MPKRLEIVANVLGAQARFSTTQQLLFVNSPDLKKQTSCIQIVFFSKKHSSLKMWAV